MRRGFVAHIGRASAIPATLARNSIHRAGSFDDTTNIVEFKKIVLITCLGSFSAAWCIELRRYKISLYLDRARLYS